jgi:hypothetical protein
MSNAEQFKKIARDIMRENATRVFTTKCTACAKSYTQRLSWLQAKRFVCPSCGGRLDDAPLHQLTLSAMRELRSGAATPKKRAIRRVKPVPGEQCDDAKDYQLVLQFRGDSLADYDAMVALENELIAELGDSADVDGHDVGSGEVNIFITTADPVRTFQQSKVVLERKGCLGAVTAAYRPVDGESYTTIWPVASREGFRIA